MCENNSFECYDNENENVETYDLNVIRESIESMNKFNQVEVLRILSKYKDVILNENKYGVHINLSDLNTNIIKELKSFIEYVIAQEKSLYSIEKQKESFKNTYFTKDNKDIHVKNIKLNA